MLFDQKRVLRQKRVQPGAVINFHKIHEIVGFYKNWRQSLGIQ